MTATIIQIPTKTNKLKNAFDAVADLCEWKSKEDPIYGVVDIGDLGVTIEAIQKFAGLDCNVLTNSDGTRACIMTVGLFTDERMQELKETQDGRR